MAIYHQQNLQSSYRRSTNLLRNSRRHLCRLNNKGHRALVRNSVSYTADVGRTWNKDRSRLYASTFSIHTVCHCVISHLATSHSVSVSYLSIRLFCFFCPCGRRISLKGLLYYLTIVRPLAGTECTPAGTHAGVRAAHTRIREVISFVAGGLGAVSPSSDSGIPLRYYCTAVLRFETQKHSLRFSPCGHWIESPQTS